MQTSYLECAPRNRCRNYRRCDACSQIRQAQIAGVAERGAVFAETVTYAVVKTTSPSTIKTDKAQLQKHLKAVAHGGVWTVETGKETVGLHLNLLIGSATELPAQTIAAGWPAGGEIWAQSIERSTVRHVAAYISKREAYPEKDQYSGHIYGSWGQWRSPLQVLAGQGTVPEMQAVALDYQLWQLGVSAPIGSMDVDSVKSEQGNEERAQEQQRQATRKKSARFARVLAAAEGRADVNGLVFVQGYGLKTLNEVKGMRQHHEKIADCPD